jgi:TonB-linked SusC/RagA family outer membrane protein
MWTGNFLLPLPPPPVNSLEISYIGYITKEVPIGDNTQFTITLMEDSNALDEVVVVGYGRQSKHKITGAISAVSEKDLSGRQVRSVEQMLQGKMPGVTVKSNSGKPGGEGISIVIRGMNSFATNSNPLILIDGVVGDMNSLAPENIESISVMKDAASAAIYGSRAANGVILVTSKRGQAGRLNITYNASLSTQYYTAMPETVMDPVEYMNMWNRAAEYSNDPFRYKDEWITGMANGTYQGYDYTDNIFKHALVQSHNVNMNGGTEKIRFNMGINYLDQPGIVKEYNYDRINLLLNVDAQINKWISAGGQINATRGLSAEPVLGDWEVFLGYYNQKPTTPPQFPDGRWVSTQFPGEPFTWSAAEKLARGQTVNTRYYGDMLAYIKITPIENLVWETKVATKYNHEFNKSFNTGNHEILIYSTGERTEPQNPNGRSVSVNSPVSLYNTLYSTLNYTREINRHNIDVLAGFSAEEYTINNINARRSNYVTDNLGEINAGDVATVTNGGNSESYALRSFFARFNYDYQAKYLFQANIRADESSRFPSGKRTGIFPSFSAGWRISQDFFPSSSWLSDLKLRASWGQLGNQDIGIYPYQETYSLGKYYPFSSGLSNGILQDGLKNRNLTWEATTSTDVGVDMNIKNGLFTLSLEYFHKLTDGILRSQQVTALVGLAAPTVNNGAMANEGFELTLGHAKRINNKFDYWVNGNICFSKNTVVDFGSPEIETRTIKEEGGEWNAWYMYEFDGVYQTQAECEALPVSGNIMTPGTAKFKDQNGDGKITTEDRTYVGHKYPATTYGINLGGRYGDFDCSVFLQGIGGIDSYQTEWGIEPFVQSSRPTLMWRDAWTPENHSNTLPALYVSRKGNVLENYANTFYLHDASYFRLKNVQIGYNLPGNVLNRIMVSSARVYLSGENILTFTNFPGQDPERDWGSTTMSAYPQIKSFSFGLSVKF